MNTSYQKTRATLGKNIDLLMTEKELNSLIELLTPYKSSFEELISLINDDLNKLKNKDL